MSRLFLELCVSITASAILALMVATGGIAMARLPSDAAVQAEAPGVDRPDPLTICRGDGERVACIREET